MVFSVGSRVSLTNSSEMGRVFHIPLSSYFERAGGGAVRGFATIVTLLSWKFLKDRKDADKLLLNKLIEVSPCGGFALPRFHRSIGSSTKVSTISDMMTEELAGGRDPRGVGE